MGSEMAGMPAPDGDTGAPEGRAGGKQIRSPAPPPGANLTPRERKVWDYICASLRDEGLSHRAAGITIATVCQTYLQYLDAFFELRNWTASNNGSLMQRAKSSDYQQPHPLVYLVRDLRKELAVWLLEGSLTMPSLASVKAKMGEEGQQDDLFADLLEHALAERSVASRPGAQRSMSSV